VSPATLMSVPTRGAPRATVPNAGRGGLATYKFGGAALADGAAMRHAAAIVGRRTALGTVVVASAMAGVTDALLAIAHAATGSAPLGADVDRLRALHLRAAEDALPNADEATRAGVAAAIHDAFDELERVVAAVRELGELRPRDEDRIVARGERLAARLLAAALDASGVRAAYVDATCVVETDGRHGLATPDLDRTTAAARRVLRPLIAAGVVPVVPGFIGRGRAGDVVTLGRGGSDLTATLLAAALGARRVVLWKDVPGLLTADPRVVPDARLAARLNVREAAELSRFGAKVLHPRALAALGDRARVVVRPFAQPELAGTEISTRQVRTRSPVKAIAAIMDQALVTVTGRGLVALPGVAARTFGALHAAGVAASLASQGAGEHAVTFTVWNGDVTAALDALRAAFAGELARGELAAVDARVGVATLGIVGLGLEREPAVAARAFGALAEARIDVLALALDAGGASLALVVDGTRAVEAQRALHAAFALHQAGGGRAAATAHADVVLLGVGAIGRALLGLAAPTSEARGTVRVCGLVDRSGWLFDPRGLSRRRLAEAAAHKASGGALAALDGARAGDAHAALDAIGAHALSRPILVDATAADTTPLLESALGRGWDLVLANKVPLAARQDAVDRLHAAARGRRLLHEATVGAGLPVIDTLHKLLDAGDRVLRIEGCPSGTLGFLFGELGRGRRFSEALRSAVALGYTEPDPRVDLSGTDVARKALILARLLGFRGDLEALAVESLVPPALRDVPADEFLARLDEVDAAWDARVRTARARGGVLRYRARVTRRSIRVGLVAVPVTGPLGSLSGTDNQFAFTTARYREQPLVITGPGAGAAVTAAGVYNDLRRIAGDDRRPRSTPHGAGRIAS